MPSSWQNIAKFFHREHRHLYYRICVKSGLCSNNLKRYTGFIYLDLQSSLTFLLCTDSEKTNIFFLKIGQDFVGEYRFLTVHLYISQNELIDIFDEENCHFPETGKTNGTNMS